MKYLLISLLALFSAANVSACWYPWWTPGGYYMYRVNNSKPAPKTEVAESNPGSSRNCKEWQKLTSASIPLDDIYKVVYEMPLSEFEQVYDTKEANGNRFLKWIIKNDKSILDFLLLAKTNEYIRLQRNSRWYYPSMKIGARMTIEEIAEKALAANAPELRDRYLLQAIRALFTLGKYQECIDLWNTEIENLPEENLMRQLIQPYIAGAEFRVKRSEKAITYFAQAGDVGSMLYCAGRTGEHLSTIEALELVCEYAPDSKYIEETLQEYVRSLEPEGDYDRYYDYEYEESAETRKLYNLCLKMAKNPQCNNPGMWYYTAAFLADRRGDEKNASYLIGLAENSKKTPFIDESIKVFRIYIDAKTMPYNSQYESKLFTQLQWLDSKILNNITDEVRREVANGGDKLLSCESFYYWNDMMRRILLAEVCPRMIKEGKTIRALQLANMADNRLFGIVNRINDYTWIVVDGEYEKKIQEAYTLSGYRYSEEFNRFDYSNFFFEMIDSSGVDTAIKYLQNVQKPSSEFDRFLNERGYTGSDYLNDIAGTQCLRNMRYKEAVEYLGKVSEAYKNHLNVTMNYNPFSIERRSISSKTDFRFNFARRMYALEQSIELTTEPNKKARLLIEYATGIRNSFDYCWALTQYYRCSVYYGQVCEKRGWDKDDITLAARNRAIELAQLACNIITDPVVGSEINYALCNFKTVAEKYPNTELGMLVIGQCDNLYDHQALSSRTSHTYW